MGAYPCTVVADRYGGTYSGGQWLAFPCEPDEVPPQVNSGDVESMLFWGGEDVGLRQPDVGRGSSPQGAIDDMLRRADERASSGETD